MAGETVATALAAMTAWLKGMLTGAAILLGAIVGGHDGLRHGRRGQKVGLHLAAGLIAAQAYGPMAAATGAGTTVPATNFARFESRDSASRHNCGYREDEVGGMW